jgi:hypothetical protein
MKRNLFGSWFWRKKVQNQETTSGEGFFAMSLHGGSQKGKRMHERAREQKRERERERERERLCEQGG